MKPNHSFRRNTVYSGIAGGRRLPVLIAAVLLCMLLTVTGGSLAERNIELPYGLKPGMSYAQAVRTVEGYGLQADAGIEGGNGMVFYNPQCYGIVPQCSTLEFMSSGIQFTTIFLEDSRYSAANPSWNFNSVTTQMISDYGTSRMTQIRNGGGYDYVWKNGQYTIELRYDAPGEFSIFYQYRR